MPKKLLSHVQAWYRTYTDNYSEEEYAQQALIDQWFDYPGKWQITINGCALVGKLIGVYDRDYVDEQGFAPAFEIEIPVDGNEFSIRIRAHFSCFEQVKEG